MTPAIVKMVRDTLARVRHLSPAAVRQESVRLVEQLPHADRAVLRMWAVELARALGPLAAPRPLPRPEVFVCKGCKRKMVVGDDCTYCGAPEPAPASAGPCPVCGVVVPMAGVLDDHRQLVAWRVEAHGDSRRADAATCSGAGMSIEAAR